MAYSIREQSGNTYTYVTELSCDTEADLRTIPKNVAPGSVCIVIENSKVFMKNTLGDWIEIGE